MQADTDRLQALLSSLQCSPRREPYDPPDRYTARVAKLQGSNVLAQLSLLKTMKLDKCTDAEIELQVGPTHFTLCLCVCVCVYVCVCA